MKKLTNSLCALTALVLLVSCNKDAESGGAAPDAPKTNFSVALPGDAETYGVEDPQSAGQIVPFYNDVTVYLLDAGNNAVGYAWTDTEIKNREKRFEQIVEPAGVVVVVNAGSITMPTGSLSAAAFQTAVLSLTVSDQNLAAKTLVTEDAKGNVVGTYLSVQQVALYGEQSVFTTMTSDDGHTLKKAAVELKSLVSRFEVGTLKAGAGLDALTVEAVYLNNFYNNIGLSSAQQFTEATWPVTFTPAWATDGYNAAVTSAAGTKAYAYQVFYGDLMPHIIYKVSGTVSAGYKLADGTGDADSPTPFTGKYVTVTGYREAGSLISHIDPHKIYKMGLESGGIVITPGTITDIPEKNKIDLVMAVTIADWSISNVVPEI